MGIFNRYSPKKEEKKRKNQESYMGPWTREDQLASIAEDKKREAYWAKQKKKAEKKKR